MTSSGSRPTCTAWRPGCPPSLASKQAARCHIARCGGRFRTSFPYQPHVYAPHTVVQLRRKPSSAAVYSSGCLRKWPTCSDTCQRASRTSAHARFCRRPATSSASLCRDEGGTASGQLASSLEPPLGRPAPDLLPPVRPHASASLGPPFLQSGGEDWRGAPPVGK